MTHSPIVGRRPVRAFIQKYCEHTVSNIVGTAKSGCTCPDLWDMKTIRKIVIDINKLSKFGRFNCIPINLELL